MTASSRGQLPLKLEWTFKRSFIEYATGVPDFQMYVSDGAWVEVRASEVFFWPVKPERPDLATAGWRFGGSIEMIAYAGLMDIQLRDPRLIHGADPHVSVNIVDRTTGEPKRETLVHLNAVVDFEADGHIMMWNTALSDVGSQMLGDVYPAGTSLDPIKAHFAAPPLSPPARTRVQ